MVSEYKQAEQIFMSAKTFASRNADKHQVALNWFQVAE